MVIIGRCRSLLSALGRPRDGPANLVSRRVILQDSAVPGCCRAATRTSSRGTTTASTTNLFGVAVVQDWAADVSVRDVGTGHEVRVLGHAARPVQMAEPVPPCPVPACLPSPCYSSTAPHARSVAEASETCPRVTAFALHAVRLNLSHRQSATTAGAPTDQVRVCLSAPLAASATLPSST